MKLRAVRSFAHRHEDGILLIGQSLEFLAMLGLAWILTTATARAEENDVAIALRVAREYERRGSRWEEDAVSIVRLHSMTPAISDAISVTKSSKMVLR